MTGFLEGSVLDAIHDAVVDVEARTDAELVPTLAKQSDDYRYIPMIYGLVLALALPFPFLLLDVAWPVAWISVYEAQIALAAVLCFLIQVLPIRFHLVPLGVLRSRAARMARAQFLQQRVHMARDHLGVLLFVSVDERYVEIIADEGLNGLVESAEWAKVTEDFVAAIRAGDVARGFQEAIKEIGDLLERAAPRTEAAKLDLPNRLIVLV